MLVGPRECLFYRIERFKLVVVLVVHRHFVFTGELADVEGAALGRANLIETFVFRIFDFDVLENAPVVASVAQLADLRKVNARTPDDDGADRQFVAPRAFGSTHAANPLGFECPTIEHALDLRAWLDTLHTVHFRSLIVVCLTFRSF